MCAVVVLIGDGTTKEEWSEKDDRFLAVTDLPERVVWSRLMGKNHDKCILQITRSAQSISQESSLGHWERGASHVDEELFLRVANLSIFQELPPARIERFLSTTRVCSYRARQIIRAQGERTDAGFLILSGRVSLITEVAHGKSLMMNILTEGDLYAFITPLIREFYPATLKAQSDCSCLCIPKPAIRELVEEFPPLIMAMNEYLFSRLEDAQHLCRLVARDKLEVKLGAILYKLANTFGESGESPGEGIELEITRQELAELCGASIEKVIGCLTLLEEAEFIATPKKGRIRILRREKLIPDLL